MTLHGQVSTGCRPVTILFHFSVIWKKLRLLPETQLTAIDNKLGKVKLYTLLLRTTDYIAAAVSRLMQTIQSGIETTPTSKTNYWETNTKSATNGKEQRTSYIGADLIPFTAKSASVPLWTITLELLSKNLIQLLSSIDNARFKLHQCLILGNLPPSCTVMCTQPAIYAFAF